MRVVFKPQLFGKHLRWVVCLVLLDAKEPLTVAEIVERVETKYVIAGRAGKAVSDSLRWEVGRGRVVQISRGRYASGLIPRSTEYSLRKRVEDLDLRLSLVATSAAATDANAVASTAPAPDEETTVDWYTAGGYFNLDLLDEDAGDED